MTDRVITPRPRKPAMSPEELREFRLARGWNQTELARRIGVSSAAVSLWEAGRRAIPQPVALALKGIDNVEMSC